MEQVSYPMEQRNETTIIIRGTAYLQPYPPTLILALLPAMSFAGILHCSANVAAVLRRLYIDLDQYLTLGYNGPKSLRHVN